MLTHLKHLSGYGHALVVKTSYRDNEHLSEELMVEIEHLKATDPDE